MKERPIGIFDSGVGGLTVLREIEKVSPHEDIIYFGDTARVPYGNKSKNTIIRFSTDNVLFLLKKKVKLVVVACNTASALALDYLKKAFPIPIVGVIEAGVKKAIGVSLNKRIGVVGTKSTIASQSYQRQILRQDRKIKIYSAGCPLFVPLAEEGILKGTILRETLNMYLQKFKTTKIDTIILGCTHYPLLKRQIAGYLKGVRVIDSAKEVALHTKIILEDKNLLTGKRKKGTVDFYVSDEPKEFARLARLFLGRKISKPRKTNA